MIGEKQSKSRWGSEEKKSVRERFNNFVRRIGNHVYSGVPSGISDRSNGLGDFLTEKARFRNTLGFIVGATGAGVYLGTVYYVSSECGLSPIPALISTAVFGVGSFWMFAVGYVSGDALGERIDDLFGDETPRLREERRIKSNARYYADIRSFMTPEELAEVEASGGIRKYQKQRKKFLKKYTNGGKLGAP